MRTTSSSTSSSDAHLASAARLDAGWVAFIRVLVGAAALMLAALVGIAYAIDPYDTGWGLLAKPGVRPQGPRTAGASRGRDPAFRGAIFGNSHIQLVSPGRLEGHTGIPFVQMSVPASGPSEQLVLLDWFLRHRQEPAQALVLGVDETWCTPDTALPNEKPFPFWLYSHDRFAYLRGLLRFDVLEEIPRRLAYLRDADAPRARPDGYWDYEDSYRDLGFLGPEGRARLEAESGAAATVERLPRYPAAERLGAALAGLGRETPVVLVFPPVYLGSRTAVAPEHDCREAFRQVAARHGRSAAVVDWRVDRPETRDPNQFFDRGHYREPIARLIEADVAAALAHLR